MADNEGTVARTVPILSEDSLRNVDSMSDAIALLRDSDVEAVNIADVMGDGFTLVETADGKDAFIDKEFVILDWEFRPGDFGTPFVTMRVVTADDGKYRINDGSTGIRAQLEAFSAQTGRFHGMHVPKGLRKSFYFIHRETREPVAKDYDGPKDPASTYYLNTSK